MEICNNDYVMRKTVHSQLKIGLYVTIQKILCTCITNDKNASFLILWPTWLLALTVTNPCASNNVILLIPCGKINIKSEAVLPFMV